MKNSYLLFSVCCLFLFVFSCKQKADYIADISRLDSASTRLVICEKNLLTVDTNALHTSYNAISKNLHDLIEKISADTVEKKTAILLSVTYEHIRNIQSLLENKKYFIKAMQESGQRINDLKHDLTENLIEHNKSATYIVNEINNAGKICNAVNKTIEKAIVSQNKIDSLKTEIIFLADSLAK